MALKSANPKIANDAGPLHLTMVDSRRVGDILKDARNTLSQDLAYVSEQLRIRRVFIEAIEESKLDELPGLPYAIGFVRAYAEHLDLDSAKLVEKFKDEASALSARTELLLPEPIVAGRTPTGPVVLLSLLLLAGGYGGWLYVSNQDRDVVELVPPLPAAVAEFLNIDQGAAPGVEQVQQIEQIEPAAQSGAPVTETLAPEFVEAEFAEAEFVQDSAATELGETTAAAVAETQETIARGDAVALADTAVPETPAPETAVPEISSETAATDTEALETSVASATGDPVSDEPAVGTDRTLLSAGSIIVEAPPLSGGLEDGAEGNIYGQENLDARVVIAALSPAWVEVTAPSGEVLLTRLLRTGDLFRAPNVEGLVLVTGNAGGLEMRVDGKVAPPIGDIGAVRRNVSLNPAALLAGESNQ